MFKRYARLAGTLPGGKRVYRVPFKILFNDSRSCATVAEVEGDILAFSAADAANYMLREVSRPETEVYAWGPKGGEVHRYEGWESFIGRSLFAERGGHHQLALDFPCRG